MSNFFLDEKCNQLLMLSLVTGSNVLSCSTSGGEMAIPSVLTLTFPVNPPSPRPISFLIVAWGAFPLLALQHCLHPPQRALLHIPHIVSCVSACPSELPRKGKVSPAAPSTIMAKGNCVLERRLTWQRTKPQFNLISFLVTTHGKGMPYPWTQQ